MACERIRLIHWKEAEVPERAQRLEALAFAVDTDLSEDVIRDHAVANGMVDTKVCAIDDTWSGLPLTRRRS